MAINKLIEMRGTAARAGLLALNAALEAARSGSNAGRGLAVLAQEVGNLANGISAFHDAIHERYLSIRDVIGGCRRIDGPTAGHAALTENPAMPDGSRTPGPARELDGYLHAALSEICVLNQCLSDQAAGVTASLRTDYLVTQIADENGGNMAEICRQIRRLTGAIAVLNTRLNNGGFAQANGFDGGELETNLQSAL